MAYAFLLSPRHCITFFKPQPKNSFSAIVFISVFEALASEFVAIHTVYVSESSVKPHWKTA